MLFPVQECVLHVSAQLGKVLLAHMLVILGQLVLDLRELSQDQSDLFSFDS